MMNTIYNFINYLLLNPLIIDNLCISFVFIILLIL